MAFPRRDTLHHTYREYLTWSEMERDELVDGAAYVKEPPAPSRSHQEIVGELYFQLRLALEGKACRIYVAPFDLRLPKGGETDEEIDTVVQPDLLIVCDLRKLDERGMRGAPDWIAEVLSPASARYDQTLKLAAYERAGVPEVWLVDPIERTLSVHRLEGARYGRPVLLELEGRTALAAIPGASIDWDRLPPRSS
ncbi:MAG TPA: Uma2 family endonuclease [Steroidobacteraceae bacterium]|nr:Uma2 family endonuclease [Steroidobacteraceae bacterium]